MINAELRVYIYAHFPSALSDMIVPSRVYYITSYGPLKTRGRPASVSPLKVPQSIFFRSFFAALLSEFNELKFDPFLHLLSYPKWERKQSIRFGKRS